MPTEAEMAAAATAPEATAPVEWKASSWAEAIIMQIIDLISQLSTEDQISLLGLLNGQFNVASEEAKASPEAENARVAEMANAF